MVQLKAGNDIVIGNRYGKPMEKGAMSFSHRYIGTPLLSFLIRRKYHIQVKDINCGLRGMKKEAITKLNCQASGMEFASEMMINASVQNLKITEVPISFYRDKREGKSHLKTIPDGIRHLVEIGKNKKIKQEETKTNPFTYLKSFFLIVLLGIIALIITVYLPDEKVKENTKQAAQTFKETTAIFPEIEIGRAYTTVDHYADSIWLSIIYSLDKNDPLASIMKASYHHDQNKTITTNFLELTTGEAKAETEYVRYWHGSIVWIKPLLMFFSLEQIYQISSAIVWGLLILLLILLAKVDWRAVIAFIIAIIMIAFFVVPQCLEYTGVFVLTFLISILVLVKDKGKNSLMYHLFFITGALTCYFDFLTVEMLTILLPLTIILIKRNKQNQIGTTKEMLKFIFTSLILWLIAYAGMYLTKWILASIILNKNCIIQAIQSADIRINGEVRYIEESQMWIQAIKRNFDIVNPIFFIRKKYYLYAMLPIIWLGILVINHHQGKKISYLISMSILSLMPYLRYIALRNHSCYHFIFTFRLQLVTIIIFMLLALQMVTRNKKQNKDSR